MASLLKLFQRLRRYSHEQFPLSGKPGERDHHKLIRSLPRCQIPATVDSIWLPRCSKAAANGFPHLSFPSVSGFKKNLPSGQGKLVLRSWAPSSLPAWPAEGMGGSCAKGRSVPGHCDPALKSEGRQGPGKKNAAGCSTCQASNELRLGLGLHSSCTLQ